MEGNDYSVITSRFVKIKKDRIRQWDIFKCEEFSYWWNKFRFPYIFVLSQDCDLAQDYINYTEESSDDDKIIESILICPMFNLEDLLSGNHINIEKDTWDIIIKKMWVIKWDIKQNLKKNLLDRYFSIKSFSDDEIIIPDLVMDFKFFMTISRDVMYSKYTENYVCSVSELFREKISIKFANYLSRIWLPELKEE